MAYIKKLDEFINEGMISGTVAGNGAMFAPTTEVELVNTVHGLFAERGLDGDYSDIDISGIRDAGIVKELARNGKLDKNAIGVLYLLGLSDEKDIEDKVFAPYSFAIDIKEKYPDGSGFEVDGELEAGISCNDNEDVIYIQYEGGLYFKYKAFWDDIYRRDDYDLEQYMSDEIKKPEIRLGAWSHNTYSIEKFPINAILGKYMCEIFEKYVDKNDDFTNDLIAKLYPPVEDDREPYDD